MHEKFKVGICLPTDEQQQQQYAMSSPPMTSTPNDVVTSLRDATNKENTVPPQADRIKAMYVYASIVAVPL